VKKAKLLLPPQPIVWPRADPAALRDFDPATRRCTMNCGQHRDDPRSRCEMLLLCNECDELPPYPDECQGDPGYR
jgi:hypothetical protein